MVFRSAREPALAIRCRFGGEVALRFNGKDMKEAVLKTDQFEMRILDFTPDRMRIQVRNPGQPFNFVPRFLDIAYPDRTIAVKDTGIIAIATGKTIEQVVDFQERVRIEPFLMMDLRYARRKLATITVE